MKSDLILTFAILTCSICVSHSTFMFPGKHRGVSNRGYHSSYSSRGYYSDDSNGGDDRDDSNRDRMEDMLRRMKEEAMKRMKSQPSVSSWCCFRCHSYLA